MSTRHSADPNPHIVFIGNPADGFYPVGPFDTQDDAVRYIGGEHHKENCWAMELCAPASDEGEPEEEDAPARLGDEIVEQERSMEAVNDGFERLAKSIESIPAAKPTAVEEYAAWLARQPKPKTMAEALNSLDNAEAVLNALAEGAGERQSPAEALANAHGGGSHPVYTMADWQHEVAQANTTLGYWDWVLHAIEDAGSTWAG